MSVDFSTFSSSQIVWLLLAIVGVVVVFVVIRFFWKHLLKYLFQGCLIILAVIALLALLRYFKVF
jgi:cell division protein FtsW (lipid II flippase)